VLYIPIRHPMVNALPIRSRGRTRALTRSLLHPIQGRRTIDSVDVTTSGGHVTRSVSPKFRVGSRWEEGGKLGKWERTLGLVDIHCEGGASCSYGEKGGRQSLRWNQLTRRSPSLLLLCLDRTGPSYKVE
jgi:hypothetical protein